LPVLPSQLTKLNCEANRIQELPKIPTSLYWLRCCSNKLRVIPDLPEGLRILECWHNPLTDLFEGLVFREDKIEALRAYYAGRALQKSLGRDLLGLSLVLGRTSLPADVVNHTGSFLSGENRNVGEVMHSLREKLLCQ
jgi:hypothetical protein